MVRYIVQLSQPLKCISATSSVGFLFVFVLFFIFFFLFPLCLTSFSKCSKKNIARRQVCNLIEMASTSPFLETALYCSRSIKNKEVVNLCNKSNSPDVIGSILSS